jgi:adenosylhomocysteine nucleosidase
MKLCVGIIAALPREVKALVKGWRRREVASNVWVWTNGRAVVACAGMGAARVELAMRAAMDAMPLTDLISVGLAGACDPRLRAGEIVRAGVTLDAQSGEEFTDVEFQQRLVSTSAIASVKEKMRLRAEYEADAVDMEATTVARFAHAHGLRYRAIKAISDEADFEVKGLLRFVTADGQFRETAFALHAALRPAMWGKLIALGRNSGVALAALTKALEGELDWYETRG